MFGSILSAIVDGLLSAAIRWLQGIQQRREDRQAGKMEQHTADVEATVKEATDNAKVRENVQAESDAQLNDDLNRLRNANASPSNK